jgi:hypothetical protein
MRSSLLLALTVVFLGWGMAGTSAEGDRTSISPRELVRFPHGHIREGLPVDGRPVPMYAAQADHWLNELHALLFVQDLIPEEIGKALNSERNDLTDEAFFVKSWQFKKRKGSDTDRTTFGGDVRVSALIAVDEPRKEKLLKHLARLASKDQVEQIPELKEPLARLLLQWDILSVWWRLETDRNWNSDDPVLLKAMAKAVQSLVLPKLTLQLLPSGTNELLQEYGRHSEPKLTSEPYLPSDLFSVAKDSPWVEIERKSTRLFRGETALRASRVLYNLGDRSQAVRLIDEAGKKDRGKLEVPAGTQLALVLTLVGIDDQMQPVATPVVDEVRIRRLTGPFELAAKNHTSSHDGVDHWIYYRSRAGSLLGKEPFRFIPDTTQSLFLEYGTVKHTTFAAQCSLCHRTEVNSLAMPLGISSLSPAAKPKVASDAGVRLRLAEVEMKGVGSKLQERLK